MRSPISFTTCGSLGPRSARLPAAGRDARALFGGHRLDFGRLCSLLRGLVVGRRRRRRLGRFCRAGCAASPEPRRRRAGVSLALSSTGAAFSGCGASPDWPGRAPRPAAGVPSGAGAASAEAPASARRSGSGAGAASVRRGSGLPRARAPALPLARAAGCRLPVRAQAAASGCGRRAAPPAAGCRRSPLAAGAGAAPRLRAPALPRLGRRAASGSGAGLRLWCGSPGLPRAAGAGAASGSGAGAASGAGAGCGSGSGAGCASGCGLRRGLLPPAAGAGAGLRLGRRSRFGAALVCFGRRLLQLSAASFFRRSSFFVVQFRPGRAAMPAPSVACNAGCVRRLGSRRWQARRPSAGRAPTLPEAMLGVSSRSPEWIVPFAAQTFGSRNSFRHCRHCGRCRAKAVLFVAVARAAPSRGLDPARRRRSNRSPWTHPSGKPSRSRR